MFDMHYDLLSVLYYCYLKNDFSYLDRLKSVFREDNITGIISNLDVSAISRCIEIFNVDDFDIVEVFKITTNLAREYFPDLDMRHSIEGCDYINNLDELVSLKDLGLSSILLVWNNENKYGSGNKSVSGLSDLGKEFLKRCVELGLVIDVSHMNDETIDDTIKYLIELKSTGSDVNVIASHSNNRDLCDVKRNLSSSQLKKLSVLDTCVGVVSYSEFVNYDEFADTEVMEEMYLKHIMSISEIVGIENVGVATDDMHYGEELFLVEQGPMVFNHASVRVDITRILNREFNLEEINGIMRDNIYKKLGGNKNDRYKTYKGK